MNIQVNEIKIAVSCNLKIDSERSKILAAPASPVIYLSTMIAAKNQLENELGMNRNQSNKTNDGG
jgi:hypothetical protein